RRSVLQIERTALGREGRHKLYRMMADGVWRERRAAKDSDDHAAPPQWPVRSSTLIPYPDGMHAGAEPVLNTLMLIPEAARLVQSTARDQADFAVLADAGFYRVELHALPPETMSADWRLQSGKHEQHVRGERSVRRVLLVPQPLDADPDEDPLTLLELS